MIIYREGKKILEIKDFKVVGKFMEVATLDCTIKSPTPIEFKIGDYVVYDYNGLTYSLYDIPTPKKQARSGSYGEAFIYELKFKSNMEQLSICPFLDMVANDNGLHYTSLPSFSTFENVYGIATRVQANMDYLYPNKWRIVVADTDDPELLETLNEAKDFSISGQSCLEGLKKVYETWGVGFIHTVSDGLNVITIGKSAGTTSLFRYGKGQGLRTIKKSLQNSDQFCTRVYAYGSTRNIPARWYNEKGYIGEAQYAPYLMIPPSKWADGKPQGAYIDAVFGDEDRVKKYGLRIKTFSYDGSNGRDEIFPSIEKVTAGNIRTAKQELGETKYTPSAAYSDAERMDYILEGSNIEDDGTTVQAGYNLYSDSIKSDITPASGVFVIAEDKGDGTYRQLSLTEEIPICRFNITKLAEYKVGEIDNILTFEKNEFESTVNVEFFMKRPTGDYLKLSQVPYLHQGSAQIVVPLVESEFSAAIEGVYTLVARVTVGWSETYVNPLIPEEPVDLNYTVSGGEALVYRGAKTLKSTFTIKLKQIGFDLNTVKASDGSAKTISFKSGMCSGRSFVITRCEYSASDDSWVLTCRRGVDSSVSQTFPNSIFPISAGDQFVLLNINMPDLYVHTAMQRLYDTALADLKHYSNPQFVVSPEIDNLQMARSPQTLKEGMYMPVEDADINIDDDILIDGVTITEKGNELRRFDVTLRNDKIYNRFSKIATSLSNLERSIEEAKENANNTPLTSGEDSIILGGSSPQISIWEHINVGTEEKPEWAVIPKDKDNNPVAIVTKSFISFGGAGNPSPSTGVTRLSALQDVDVELSTINEGEVLTWNGEKWENRSIKTGLDEAALGSYLTSKGYKTKEDNDALYASLTAFNTLNTRVTTFLDSENLNGTIDRWREVENFLLGYTDQQTLANILATKADLSLVNQAIERLTTVEGKVQTLSEILCIDTDGDIYIGGVNKNNQKRNFYVYGGLSFGGKGTSGSGGSGATALSGLSDVALTTLSDGQSLVYENGCWVNKKAGLNTTQLWNILGSSGAEKVHIDRLPDLSSKYLPLSGGTLSSKGDTPLVVDSTATNTYIQFLRNGTLVGYFGYVDNEPYTFYSGFKKIIHSGNIGNYALPLSGGTINGSLSIKDNILISERTATRQALFYKNADSSVDYGTNIRDISDSGEATLNLTYDNLRWNGNIVIHTGNYADTTDKRYLSLNGGRLNGNILINATTPEIVYAINNDDVVIVGYRGGKGAWLYNDISRSYLSIADDGTPTYNGNTLIHSGNIGSQSVNYASSAGNADTLDGYPASGLAKFYLSPMESGAPADSAKIWFTDTMPSDSGAIVHNALGSEKTIIAGKSSSGSGHLLQLNYIDTYLRILRCRGGNWQSTDWEKISAGYADSAGSATKLQAERTIWGQSFDGTANVSGSLYGVTNIFFEPTNNYGIYKGSTYSASLTADDIAIYAKKTVLGGAGNVLVGTTTDNGYKLDVNGTLNAGATSLSSLGVTNNATIGSLATHATLNIYGGLNVNVGDTILNGNITQLDGSAVLKSTTVSSLTSNGTINADGKLITAGLSGTVRAGKGVFYDLRPIANQASDLYAGSIGASNMRWANTYLAAVDISGNVRMKPTNANYGSYLYFGDGSYCYIAELTDDKLTINADSGLYITADTTIGSSSSNKNLTTYGNFVVSGSITFGTASDRRLKDNIKSMTDEQATFVLKALNPVTYQWNSTAYELGKLSGVSDGFIADEYEKLIPNSGRLIWGNYRAINYERATSYLVKGWQNHETRLERLERENKELRKEVEQLKQFKAQYGTV